MNPRESSRLGARCGCLCFFHHRPRSVSQCIIVYHMIYHSISYIYIHDIICCQLLPWSLLIMRWHFFTFRRLHTPDIILAISHGYLPRQARRLALFFCAYPCGPNFPSVLNNQTAAGCRNDMSNRNPQNQRKTKVVGSGHVMFKFVRKHSQPIGCTYRYPIFAHSMEIQTFTADRGPPTLAMSIAGSK